MKTIFYEINKIYLVWKHDITAAYKLHKFTECVCFMQASLLSINLFQPICMDFIYGKR